MKILFAIKAIDDVSGGAEKVISEISSGMAQRGHDTALLSFDQPGGKPFYNLDSSVRRLCLGIGNSRQKTSIVEFVARIHGLRKRVLAEKPDTVVAFMPSMYVLMSLALIGTNIPIIASEHTTSDYYRYRKLQFLLFIISAYLTDRMTVLSDRVKEPYPKILHKHMIAVPNPVSVPGDIARTREDIRYDSRNIILSVGRLDPQKDQSALIRAFAKIASDYPDWSLRIIGDGELRPRLKRLIRRLGLQKRAYVPGHTKNIAREYMRADIFVTSSLYEGFGLSTAEAMSFAIPAIGFADCPGTNELIQDKETGVLVKGSHRATALAEVLKEMMDSPELRKSYGEKGRESVRKYQPEKITDMWEDLIRKTVLRRFEYSD